MLGAEVRPVTSGNMTLKDATNEAIRDWCCHLQILTMSSALP